MAQTEKALSGYRVIDITQVESGPTCTQALAWLGADVIKVEPPKHGDASRGSPTDEPGMPSPYFLEINSNKRSITLDLKTEKGVEVFLELVKQGDVVTENMANGVLEKLGLGYDVLCAANPRIILGRIKGFGTWGPYSEYKCFDQIAQAAGGSYASTGEADGPPTKLGLTLGDIGTGYHTALGITAALLQRERTGRGQTVEVSMQDAMINFSRTGLAWNSVIGSTSPWRRGDDCGDTPGRMYPCKPGGPDDYCYVYASDWVAGSWEGLLRGMGREDLIGDERYDTDPKRRQRQAEVDALVEEWTLQHTKYEVMNRLAPLGTLAGAVLNPTDLASDPHVAAREMIQEVDHPERGKYKLYASPIKLSDSPCELEPPPLLGQHSEEVLKELLGYSDAQVQTLRGEGVI